MKRLVLDFLQRWWWVLLSMGILSLPLSMVHAVSFAPLALILLIMDSQRGVLHAIRPLPVSKRDQEKTWWFISVGLITLIFLPFTFLGVFIQKWVQVDKEVEPWFSAGFVLWVGLGVAAVMFLLCILLPTRPPQTRREWIFASVIGALWGLTIPGSMMTSMFMPKTVAAMQPWQEYLALLVPVAVVLSYFAAPIMAQKRLKPAVQIHAAGSLSHSSPKDLKGSTGLRLLIVTLLTRILGFLLFMSAVMVVTFQFLSRSTADVFPPQAAMQIFVYALMVSAFVPEWFSLRMLRTMPVSTRNLSLTLLSVPAATGMLTAPLLIMAGDLQSLGHSPWFDSLALGLFSAGLGSLILTFMCHITSNWRFTIFAVPAMIMPLDLLVSPNLRFYLFLIGVILLVGSYLFMQRGFWRSHAFYRKRQNYGMNVGQPFGNS